MSGHSKWHSIRHKKAATDAARGKIFTRHARLITIAVRDGGGDVEMNPALKTAIENAKSENMPNNNIERAIKKGTGDDKDAAQLMELSFEGYAPAGVAVFIKTVTDNRNRTVASIRSIFNKNGGNLGENGSVAWMFQQKGFLQITKPQESKKEEIELLLIDGGAEDIEENKDLLEITCEIAKLSSLKNILEKAEQEVLQAKIIFIPENTIKIEDENTAKKVLRVINALEEDDDVVSVAANFDISEEILLKI